MWSPIRDIRLIELVDKDKIVGYRIEFRRVGETGDDQWKTAHTIKEDINYDREDNSFS